MILDQNYIALKTQVIKAERRVLKELGFCVHVKHPHKVCNFHPFGCQLVLSVIVLILYIDRTVFCYVVTSEGIMCVCALVLGVI